MLLKCEKICMNFGITKALVNVDFEVEAGKISGLIGENGSGKSTLSSIIAGIYKPSSGAMTFRDAKWAPGSMLEASRGGIGIIVQEAGTIPSITVGQNIFLGQEKRFSHFGIVDAKKLNQSADEILQKIGARGIRAEMPTASLNMQERKIVEIAKAYNSNPEILIVDETTNVLSQDGRELLFRLMHRFANEGKAVIIISHDIEEVMEHCDNLTILRDGHVSAHLRREEFEIDKIKSLMIGRAFSGDYYRSDSDGYSDEVVLEAKGVTALQACTNVSLQLHKGEILGIGGLSDSGVHVIGKVLFGDERLAKGEVLLHGSTRIDSDEKAVRSGIAYISKDRDRESLALDASIAENIASAGLDVNRIAGLLYSPRKERAYVRAQSDRLKIKCTSADQAVRALSGGNKQKVVFGKWFAKECEIYIMDCPTRGINIGIKQEIYRLIYEMKKQGKSIVIISEEMPELIGMSDRLLVMKNGRINGEFFRASGMREQDILDCMI